MVKNNTSFHQHIFIFTVSLLLPTHKIVYHPELGILDTLTLGLLTDRYT